MKNFVSPHVHVNSLDSASTPVAFVAKEIELGTGAITVTDHGMLNACRKVYDLAYDKKTKEKNGGKPLIPIIGLEGYFRDDDCPILTAAGIPKLHPLKKNKEPNLEEPPSFAHYLKYMHFTVHFRDQAAFNCAVELLSKAPIERHGSETKPIFNWSDLEQLGSHNVTFGSGCLIGMVQRHLLVHNDQAMARKYYERFRSLVKPGNFYVEAFPHVCDRNWVEGVYITYISGDGLRELRYHEDKKLKTNAGEITAIELAKVWNKENNPHQFLHAVKNYHTWEDFEPLKLHGAEKREGFVMNECRPWAPTGDVQLGCNELMLGFAKEYGDKILISDDAHFASPEFKDAQDIRLQQSGSWRFHTSYHRMSSATAADYFKGKLGVSERDIEEWVENSHEWKEKFKDFKFESKVSLPTKFYPTDTLAHLKALIAKHGRMDWKDPVRVARLKEEINLFKYNGTVDLLPYFFLAEEVCALYEENELLTGPGRGSAAGCYITYLLGITHKDPIRYGLSLERFLTLDRIQSGAFPDIDMDFPHREILVNEETGGGWLNERFGDHCAQISTETMLRLKSSARDVARVMFKDNPPPGYVRYELEKLISKFAEPDQGVSDKDFVYGYEDSGEFKLGSKDWDPALQEYIRKWPAHWKLVEKLLALSRGKGRHASAFVVANEPIPKLGIPMTTIGGVKCTAFTAGPVEASGGIKMDFLVINSLKDLSLAIKLIQKRSDIEIPRNVYLKGLRVPRIRAFPAPRNKEHVLVDTTALCRCGHVVSDHQHDQQCCMHCNCEWAEVLVDIWDLPQDQDVFMDIAEGRTETVFQFNTDGAVKYLRVFNANRPDGTPIIARLEDLAAFTALDRPGPLDMKVAHPDHPDDEEKRHNLLIEYTRRAQGKTPSPDILPVFDQLLPETNGVMVYQEQLQKMYQQLTGCTLSEAEAFRRAVAKKAMEKVLKAYPFFIEKAGEKIGRENAEFAWEFMKTWANYGFNLSHAICYSDIGYACAFLKHYYPLEWWTAVLSNAKKDEISSKFWPYAGKLIDLPNVMHAPLTFEIKGKRIQAPLSLLKGIGEAAHAELAAGAPYKDVADFVERIWQTKEAGSTTTTEMIKKTKYKTDRKTKEKTLIREWEEPKVKKKWGKSAINSKIVNILMVSGAMDGLFPPGSTIFDMLTLYRTAAIEAEERHTGKTFTEAKKKKLLTIEPKWISMTHLVRYQERKALLPAYSEELLQVVLDLCLPEMYRDGEDILYRWTRSQHVRVESGSWMEQVEAQGSTKQLGVIAYVEDFRDFDYKDKKTGEQKEARAVSLDIDGIRREFVRWPEDTGKLPGPFKRLDIKGAVVLAVLCRYRTDRKFALEDLVVIQPPLPKTTEEETDDEPGTDAE